ncbi:MAG: mechanosensitive ion channel family protein [Bacteroides sp.]|nr:mechanosensitive ion channel family protein [Bacteroides sp.]MBP8621883.1 mechanosensitive ion channel family protein [Bacteroides sp.]
MEQIIAQINAALVSMGVSQSMADAMNQFIAIGLIIAIAFSGDLICRHIILRLVSRLVKRTKVTWDDIIFDRRVMIHLSHLVPPVLIYTLIPIAIEKPDVLDYILRICLIYIIVVFLRFISVFLSSVYHVYNQREQFRDRPLKGLLQTAQGILIFVGGIAIVSILIDKSPVVLLTGLGASAAILMLVFKDTIMGFVSGIQLSANNMLKVGDWIAMPKYGADGSVIEVTLNTVKVRNWDNTITTIPPYALVSDSFQNWRGMQESGGRRVKRSINIDMNSVKFCTPQMLDKYRRIHLLKTYVDETEQVITVYNKENDIDSSVVVNGRRQTNLGVFRIYLTNYLRSLPTVNQEMTCMVRQLQPTELGIPLELYFFSADKAWIPYEGLQADVFDHVLAVISEFDLHVFQSPTGEDFRHCRDDGDV